MRELAILSFITLDGVMQSPTSPRGGTRRAASPVAVGRRHIGSRSCRRSTPRPMSEPYDLLFGRKTYDVFASHWPNVSDDDPVAARLNSAHKYVRDNVIDTPNALAAHHTPVWRRSSAGQRTERTEWPALQVHGSRELIQPC